MNVIHVGSPHYFCKWCGTSQTHHDLFKPLEALVSWGIVDAAHAPRLQEYYVRELPRLQPLADAANRVVLVCW